MKPSCLHVGNNYRSYLEWDKPIQQTLEKKALNHVSCKTTKIYFLLLIVLQLELGRFFARCTNNCTITILFTLIVRS